LNIAKVLPLTYIVDLFKRIWLNSDLSWVKSNLSLKIDFIVLIFILIVCFAISVFKFRWYYD